MAPAQKPNSSPTPSIKGGELQGIALKVTLWGNLGGFKNRQMEWNYGKCRKMKVQS
jgi:hypothetical protein